MQVAQKEKYALRAVLELAKCYGSSPVKVSVIARNHAIPRKFLEAILNELKRCGVVSARRGSAGGFSLSISPSSLTVGTVVRFLRGADDVTGRRDNEQDVIKALLEHVDLAVAQVYDRTTFADLIEEERKKAQANAPAYVI